MSSPLAAAKATFLAADGPECGLDVVTMRKRPSMIPLSLHNAK